MNNDKILVSEKLGLTCIKNIVTSLANNLTGQYYAHIHEFQQDKLKDSNNKDDQDIYKSIHFCLDVMEESKNAFNDNINNSKFVTQEYNI